MDLTALESYTCLHYQALDKKMLIDCESFQGEHESDKFSLCATISKLKEYLVFIVLQTKA